MTLSWRFDATRNLWQVRHVLTGKIVAQAETQAKALKYLEKKFDQFCIRDYPSNPAAA